MSTKARTNLFSEARLEETESLGIPDRALVIAAHPDDAEFGAGGTLAKWADGGCEVSLLIATDGSKGSWDPDEDPAQLIEARREEARAAAGCSERAVTWYSSITSTANSFTRWRCGRSCRCGSDGFVPMWCSAGTRGVATCCIPTTARSAGAQSTASSRHAITSSSPTSWLTASPNIAPRRSCCSRPTSPTTGRTSPRPSTARSTHCCATRPRPRPPCRMHCRAPTSARCSQEDPTVGGTAGRTGRDGVGRGLQAASPLTRSPIDGRRLRMVSRAVRRRAPARRSRRWWYRTPPG
jgi:hypothetical protein